MMQPYAGADMGFHAPLHKDTEVLLSFMDGDPDRPVIAGAIPNPETPGPVNDGNQSMVRLKSGGGNVIHMEDQEGSQRILLHSPTAGSFIRVGYKNDPDDPPPGDANTSNEVDDPQGACMKDNVEGIKAKSEGNMTFESEDCCSIVHGDDFCRVDGDERYIIKGSTEEMVGGAASTMVGGNEFTGVLGASDDVTIGFKVGLALAGAFELESLVKGELGLGWKWTFHEMHEEFVPKKDTFEGFKDHCTGVVNHLIADHNKLVASVNVLNGLTESLSGDVISCYGQHMRMAGTIQQLAGAHDEVAITKMETFAEETGIKAEMTIVTGSAIKTAGDEVKLLGIQEKI